MKKILLAIMMAPMSVMANGLEHCTALHGFAETTMKARQDEIPMPQLIELFQDVDDPEAKKVVTMVIYAAYKQPAFGSQKYKEREAASFANKIYLECVEASSR